MRTTKNTNGYEYTNIDSRINWIKFYSQYIKNPKPCGKDKMHACCPFHNEKHPSFWFNTKNGLFKCEGCGESGNATVFLSKIENISQSDAYKQLLALAGIDTEPKKEKTVLEYSIEQYAKEKCFTVEWLKSELGISNGTDGAGKHIKIPYRDADGKVVATRKRYNPSVKPYFKWAAKSKLCLYGLWKAKDYTDYAILVEGESDSQSLWSLGFNTLGVPGATNFQTEWTEQIQHIPKLYLHQESDKGGETFIKQVTAKLYDGEYQGEVYIFNLKDSGVKDPSELYIKQGVDATDTIKAAIQKAEKINLQEVAEDLPELVKGMPVKLREPNGWRLSEDGIFKFDKRTESYSRVCRTPIIIVSRVRNLETDEEKMQIAFKKRNRWKFGIFPSTTIYQSRNIVSLAELGAMITSENAKQVVLFLEALEAENIDIIKEVPSVSQLGWATDKHFLPGLGGDILLDVERSMIGRVQAYNKAGTLEDWTTMMQKHRVRNRFRFILAAAFAPPLLKIVNQRIFFIYNWGGSEGGKTAALHAALSAWGDPDSLKVSFNATKVGLEQTAAFFKDLPFGLNERQLAGNKQETVEQLVYMLAEGVSKVRGTKSGGLQAIKQWRTVIIATGEEPLATDSSQTGVSTRVLEVYGRPFDDPQEASDMYPFTAECHGTAGVEFVKRLIEFGDDNVKKLNRVITKELKAYSDGISLAHIDGISTIVTADILASIWLFGEERSEATAKAISMGVEILKSQQTSKERDVNENATQFIIEWILSNEKQFTENAKDPRFGFVERSKYYIFPSIFKEELNRNNYSPRKTIKYLIEQGILPDKDSGTPVKYFNHKPVRMIEFDFYKASKSKADNAVDGFITIDEDDDLPF